MVAVGGSSPMMASEVMDFPEPDSPTSPSTSPGAMENDKLRIAATAAAGSAALFAGQAGAPAQRGTAGTRWSSRGP